MRFFISLSICFFIVGCFDKSIKISDPETLKTIEAGQIIGYSVSDNIAVWKGIPFAANTGGNNRWLPPQSVSSWDDVREMLVSCEKCVQEKESYRYQRYPELVGSEDCLYLDVYAPKKATKQPLPVFVWIHGGANLMGGADYIDASKFAQQ